MSLIENLDLLVKNGKVYTASGFQGLDVGVRGSEIAFLGKPGMIQGAKQVIDAKDMHVIPGIIDIHAHIREPGLIHKEDFETGTRAAAAGGVTMVCPQPNLTPVPNNLESYRQQIELGKKKSLVDFNPAASPLLYEEGWIPKLAAEGTLFFKVFQKFVPAYPYSTAAGTLHTAHLLEAFKEVATTGLYCAIHPFDHFMFDEIPNKMKKLGLPMTLKNYLPMMYTDEEMSGAAYQIYYLAMRAKMKWYALHCWHRNYIDLVRWAKTGNKIDVIASCEMCGLLEIGPQFYDVKRKEWFDYGVYTLGDVEYTWAAIKDGTIDIIATDHAPHLREEIQTKDPVDANIGEPVLEWYGHLLLNEVNHGNIALEKLVEVTSVNAAKLFGLYPRKGAILPGSDADLTICDLEKEWTITSDKVYTKCQVNPFHGRRIKGKVTHTILRGEIIMKEGEVVGKPGYGKYVTAISPH